ncbi:hypothetical protein R6Q57_029965 [Mikania cordata]
MATINQASSFLCSSSYDSSYSSSSSGRDFSRSSIQFPNIQTNTLTKLIPKIQSNIGLVEEMEFSRFPLKKQNKNHSEVIMEKLYTITGGCF